MSLDRLYALARRQGGVFARWQAAELGVSHYLIARRLLRNEWRVVQGCVLAPAAAVLGTVSLQWAAYLACGPGAVLSGPSAIGRHGLDANLPADPYVWVTIPPERHVRFSGVRTIREAVGPEDIVDRGGMRVTSPVRSIVDTLRVLPEKAGQPILDWALLRGWITTDELANRIVLFAGRRGVARLRRHHERVRDGARSAAERRLHEIIADIAGWVAGFKVYDADGVLLAVLDVAFEKVKLYIEIDGLAFHQRPDRFQGDRRRQNALSRLDWKPLRYTWDDLLHRPEAVKREILEELAKHDPTLR